jgi:hypothetical protein
VHSALEAHDEPTDLGATQVPTVELEATPSQKLGVEQAKPLVHLAPLARAGIHWPAAFVLALVQPEPFW